jgi:hypothetical protein
VNKKTEEIEKTEEVNKKTEEIEKTEEVNKKTEEIENIEQGTQKTEEKEELKKLKQEKEELKKEIEELKQEKEIEELKKEIEELKQEKEEIEEVNKKTEEIENIEQGTQKTEEVNKKTEELKQEIKEIEEVNKKIILENQEIAIHILKIGTKIRNLERKGGKEKEITNLLDETYSEIIRLKQKGINFKDTDDFLTEKTQKEQIKYIQQIVYRYIKIEDLENFNEENVDATKRKQSVKQLKDLKRSGVENYNFINQELKKKVEEEKLKKGEEKLKIDIKKLEVELNELKNIGITEESVKTYEEYLQKNQAISRMKEKLTVYFDNLNVKTNEAISGMKEKLVGFFDVSKSILGVKGVKEEAEIENQSEETGIENQIKELEIYILGKYIKIKEYIDIVNEHNKKTKDIQMKYPETKEEVERLIKNEQLLNILRIYIREEVGIYNYINNEITIPQKNQEIAIKQNNDEEPNQKSNGYKK